MTMKTIGQYLGLNVVVSDKLPAGIDPTKPFSAVLSPLPRIPVAYTFNEELEQKIVERLKQLKRLWPNSTVWWGSERFARRFKVTRQEIELALFCLASQGKVFIQSSSFIPTQFTARYVGEE